MIIELREISLPRWFMDIVDAIGVDASLIVWQRLSEHAIEIGERNRIGVPMFSTYKRYQRNRYIAALSKQGKKPSEIREIIKKDLRETISISHIQRLMPKDI